MPLCRRSYQAAYAARVDEDIDPYRFAPVGAGEYVEHITFSNFYNIYIYYFYGSTAQFGKSIRPKILPHTKVIKGREYCMYFPLL